MTLRCLPSWIDPIVTPRRRNQDITSLVNMLLPAASFTLSCLIGASSCCTTLSSALLNLLIRWWWWWWLTSCSWYKNSLSFLSYKKLHSSLVILDIILLVVFWIISRASDLGREVVEGGTHGKVRGRDALIPSLIVAVFVRVIGAAGGRGWLMLLFRLLLLIYATNAGILDNWQTTFEAWLCLHFKW